MKESKPKKFTPLFKKIYKLHLQIIKDLNNSHIFVQKVIPLIKTEVSTLKGKDDRSYLVPALKGNKTTTEAFRSDIEVKKILENIAERGLYENLLVTNISKFEGYLFQNITEVIETYPEKLNINIQGVAPTKSIPVDVFFATENREELIKYLVREKITAVSYAKPADYLKFIGQVLSIKTNSGFFEKYIEMKAARDLIIHNSGIVNDIYIAKTNNITYSVGEKIIVDQDYFGETIAVMKAISGAIRKESELVFNKKA